MTRVRYSNGAYITTSKAQDKLAQELFAGCSPGSTMGCNHDQYAGVATYTFYSPQNDEVMVVNINRKGNIV